MISAIVSSKESQVTHSAGGGINRRRLSRITRQRANRGFTRYPHDYKIHQVN